MAGERERDFAFSLARHDSGHKEHLRKEDSRAGLKLGFTGR